MTVPCASGVSSCGGCVMPTRKTGRYEIVIVGGEKVDAFVPFDLPPARPALVIDDKLEHRLREAEQALVRLDLAGEMVPSLDWFIYAFVRKEAVISSQIEGTQASLSPMRAANWERSVGFPFRCGSWTRLTSG
jgi:hypothetical protein